MTASRPMALAVFLLPAALACAAPGEAVRLLQGPDATQDASAYSAPEAQSTMYSGLTVSRANVHYRAFLRFDLSELPRDEPIADAAVMLFHDHQYHFSPLLVRAYALTAEWDQREVTWLRRTATDFWTNGGGDHDAEPVAERDLPADYGKGWVVLQSEALTRLVNDWASGKRANHGLLLAPGFKHVPGGPSMKFFVNVENAEKPGRHPKLIVSYRGPVDPSQHGYVSDAEMARLPFRRRLEKLLSRRQLLTPPLRGRADVLKQEIDRLQADDEAGANAIRTGLLELRLGLMREAQPGRTVAVWPARPYDALAPDQIPTSKEPRLAIQMLQQEYVELCVAVTSLAAEPQVLTVRIEGPEGFPTDRITLRAGYWRELHPREGTRGESEPTWSDDALPRLEEDARLALGPCETRRLWLTIHSDGIRAGKHSLLLHLTAASGDDAATTPLTLNVLPARLEPAPELRVFTYAYLNRACTADPDIRRFALQDLRDHYQNTHMINVYPVPSHMEEDGKVTVSTDFSAIGDYLQWIPDARMVLFFWNWDGSPDLATFGGLEWLSDPWRNVLRQWISSWRQHLLEQGFGPERVAFYPADETYDNNMLGRTEYQALREVARELHRIDPAIKVFADPVRFGPADLREHRAMADDIDVWSVNAALLASGDHSGWPGPYSEADKQEMRVFFRSEQERDKPVWSYEVVSVTGNALALRRYGWLAWYHGVTGLGVWSYNDIRGGTSWDATGDDFTMVYELRDAPADVPRTPAEPLIPSRRWQALRAGIQDYMLLEQVRRTRPQTAGRLKEIAQKLLTGEQTDARYVRARERVLSLLVKSDQ